jgi:hypothetical protein
MNAVVKTLADSGVPSRDGLGERGQASVGHQTSVLPQIYEDNVNIAIWQRTHASAFDVSIQTFIASHPGYALSLMTSPASAYECVSAALPDGDFSALAEDIAELVDMFCCLFDLHRAGLRLAVLERAMCPRFHVDAVPCRLVTTYCGPTTEWLNHDGVDRTKLGTGNQGLADDKSGLFRHRDEVQQLAVGDVALLKGEAWIGNEGAGLVHRSPNVLPGQRRLLLTLDFGR